MELIELHGLHNSPEPSGRGISRGGIPDDYYDYYGSDYEADSDEYQEESYYFSDSDSGSEADSEIEHPLPTDKSFLKSPLFRLLYFVVCILISMTFTQILIQEISSKVVAHGFFITQIAILFYVGRCRLRKFKKSTRMRRCAAAVHSHCEDNEKEKHTLDEHY